MIAVTERWFLTRGIPHFIKEYRASDDVFTRALPVLLGVIYLVLSYGLVPMTRWALVQTWKQLGTVAGLFGRAQRVPRLQGAGRRVTVRR